MRLLKQWIPAILWAGLILATSNNAFSAANSGGFLHAIFGVEIPYAAHVTLRKCVHILAYSVLALLAWRADRRWWVGLLVALVVASADELLQSRAPLRTGSPWDVALDVCAAGLALLLLHRFRRAPEAASSAAPPPADPGRAAGDERGLL